MAPDFSNKEGNRIQFMKLLFYSFFFFLHLATVLSVFLVYYIEIRSKCIIGTNLKFMM